MTTGNASLISAASGHPFRSKGKPRYALSVSGPASRITVECVPAIGAELREVAATISATLGHLPSLRERQIRRHVETSLTAVRDLAHKDVYDKGAAR